jgi:hypothetical protein
MRTTLSFVVAASLLLVTSVALADEPPAQETDIPPAAPVAAPAAPAAATPAAPQPPVRTVLVVRDDGWKPSADGATRMRSRGLLIGGLVTAGVGVVGIIGGAAMMASDTSTKSSSAVACSPQAVQLAGGEPCVLGAVADGLSGMQRDIGRVFVVSGGIMAAGGIVMAIAGASQVPIAAPTREQQARGIPAVAVGAGQASLRWSF